jgi:hypothetical protein
MTMQIPQEAEVTHASDVPTDVDDEEAEEDEDDADGLGARRD